MCHKPITTCQYLATRHHLPANITKRYLETTVSPLAPTSHYHRAAAYQSPQSNHFLPAAVTPPLPPGSRQCPLATTYQPPPTNQPLPTTTFQLPPKVLVPILERPILERPFLTQPFLERPFLEATIPNMTVPRRDNS